jgi:phosphatidylinositol alpha-1,6-mannosyltransferase
MNERAPPALLLTRNFPPLVGGMENLNRRLLLELAHEREVALCGPAGCAAFAPIGCPVLEAPVRPLWRFLSALLFHGLRASWRRRPGVVLAGSGLAAPMAWLVARLARARFVVYLHGLDLVAPSRVYQALWLPFIRASDLALVNSRNTATIAAERGLRPGQVEVLNPGTDVPAPQPVAAAALRAAQGWGERPVLLSVGRLTRRKGLAEFIARALPSVVARVPGVLLAIVGEDALDSLHGHAGSERARIAEAARAAGLEVQVQFLGRLEQERLDALFEAAQVHVFPVLEPVGDVEGFGMVALESAARGLRTVAFAVGGVPDAVSVPDTGTLVAPGDYAAFADAIVDALARPVDAEACRRFALARDWTQFGLRLRALLEQVDARR